MNRFRHYVSVALAFASVIAVFTCYTETFANGNFLRPSPLYRSATQARENTQTKIWEIYGLSTTSSDNNGIQRVSAPDTMGGSSASQSEHLQLKGFENFNDLLPFEWRVVSDKPLSHVLPEFIDYTSTSEITFEDLLRIFNIEVLVEPPHEFKHPDVAYLEFEIRSLERAIYVELPMHLDLTQSSYFITNPAQVARELGFEMRAFEVLSGQPGGLKPWMKIEGLRGFRKAVVHDAQVISNGIPITYKVLFGSFSVDSGFQKFGAVEISKTPNPLKRFLY